MDEESLILRTPYLQWLLSQPFPHLREWPVREWLALLGQTKHVEFEREEQIATLTGVTLVAWQVKPATLVGALALFSYLAQLIFLASVLQLVLEPLYGRRIRRGLNEAARNRDAAIEATNGKQ